jgi:hypothetical protein
MVYSIVEVVDLHGEINEMSCDKTMYSFAFRSITTTWILLALSSICLCGIICKIRAAKAFCCKKDKENESEVI